MRFFLYPALEHSLFSPFEELFNLLRYSQPLILGFLFADGCRDKLASTSKDKVLSIVDPRANKVVASVTCHEGSKATKCCWLDGFAGAPGHVLTTGFSKTNERELHLWDIRNFTKP